MWSLNEMDHQLLHSVKGHMNLAIKDIITQWKTLPKYICNAHIPLLQATQLVSFYFKFFFTMYDYYSQVSSYCLP